MDWGRWRERERERYTHIYDIYIYYMQKCIHTYIYIFFYISVYTHLWVQAPRSWSLPLKHSPMVWSLTVQVLVCTVTSSSTVPLVVLLLPTTRPGHYHSVGWGIWNHSTLAHILYIIWILHDISHLMQWKYVWYMIYDMYHIYGT